MINLDRADEWLTSHRIGDDETLAGEFVYEIEESSGDLELLIEIAKEVKAYVESHICIGCRSPHRLNRALKRLEGKNED